MLIQVHHAGWVNALDALDLGFEIEFDRDRVRSYQPTGAIRPCLGVVLPGMTHVFQLFAMLGVYGYADEAVELAQDAKIDPLGVEIIVYWSSGIEFYDEKGDFKD